MGETKRLQESNAARLRALAEKGVNIPAESVMTLRKDLMFKAMYEAVVPKDQQQAVDLEFEETMAKQIDAIEEQIEKIEAKGRVQSLLKGVPGVDPSARGPQITGV